jgi:hypothetical protein
VEIVNLTNDDNSMVGSFQYSPVKEGVMINDNVLRSLDTTGDVNNDGYHDILLGDPLSSVVYVLYGGKNVVSLNLTQGHTIIGENKEDYYGWSLAPVDYNGDNLDDILSCALLRNKCYLVYGNRKKRGDPLFGAYGHCSNTGRAWFVYGASSLTNIAVSSLGSENRMTGCIVNHRFIIFVLFYFFFLGAGAFYKNGYVITSGGDVNGDNANDILLSAPGYSSNKGLVYLVYGGVDKHRFCMFYFSLIVLFLFIFSSFGLLSL